MYESKRQKCFTMNVLSSIKATSATSGSVTTLGGIGVGNNIYVKNDIDTNELVVRKNASIENNLHIKENIQVDDIFCSKNGNFVIMTNFIPNVASAEKKYNIGSLNERWNDLYTNTVNSKIITSTDIKTSNIDIKDNISIGSNLHNKNSMIYIDKNNIVLNGDILLVDNNMSPIMSITQKTKKLGMYNIATKEIEYSPQIIELNKDCDIICVESNVILVRNYSKKPVITVTASSQSNTVKVFKIILEFNDLDVPVNVIIGNNDKYITKKGDYIEGYLFDGSVHTLNRVI